jgi:REP element-mobilizing transposase RayT
LFFVFAWIISPLTAQARDMPRRLRIEFEGAIYHVMARGNARQRIIRDDAGRRRLLDGLERTVGRQQWDLVSYVVMDNHLHLLVKTRRADLGAGMQSFLSGYAIWAGRRWRRLGHVFQGGTAPRWSRTNPTTGL